eukprot:2063567-Rhodomonas_salina.1
MQAPMRGHGDRRETKRARQDVHRDSCPGHASETTRHTDAVSRHDLKPHESTQSVRCNGPR